MASKALICNFAKRSGKTEDEVLRLWRKTAILADKDGLAEPASGCRPEEMERYAAFRVGKLKQLLRLESDEQIAKGLTEVGLKDVAAFFLGSGTSVRLNCAARLCTNNNQKGKCTLMAASVNVNRNWECANYVRRS